MDHRERMDRIYRYQRHLYDVTRPFFLFGRDRLLRGLPVRDDSAVLEVGCGTGRNLRVLSRRFPRARLFGLDISAQMLATARTKIRRAGSTNVWLVCAPAEELDAGKTFGLDHSFDVIFFSYSLSMIPAWREALRAAANNLAPGGSIHLVDFYDQADWPAGLRRILVRWLELFHVRHEPALLEYLRELQQGGGWRVHIQSLHRRYALLIRLDRSA